MAEDIESIRKRIEAAQQAGWWATIKEYTRLSGPGWLQSAITLGGGSLAGSLYLGIIGGYDMMWLQPLMMAFGVVMLSAIGYVALCANERPLEAVNRHVNPVLGWSWVVATVMANLVWAMPQFSLGTAALRQNLGVFRGDGGDMIAGLFLLAVSAVMVVLYSRGGTAFKIFDVLLKFMVGLIVVSFFLVVLRMSLSSEGLPWGRILAGFIPNPSLLFVPAEDLREWVSQSSAPGYWHDLLVSAQRDRMVAAAATAVGINMTFLMPYSLLRRGWDRTFRGLARFDLATGLFVPFVLATSGVVVAAAARFHARPEPGLIEYTTFGRAPANLPADVVKAYEKNLHAMLKATGKPDRLAQTTRGDRILAATLIRRDARALALALEQLTGPATAHWVFGIGVVGMAVSSIIILMLINGFALCETAGRPSSGPLYLVGCFLPGITGFLGAIFLWSGKAQFYLAIPTSRFGMVLLPIAYLAFFLLMNNRRVLGDAMPRGWARFMWNTAMIVALGLAGTGASVSILNDKNMIGPLAVRDLALAVVAALVIAGIVVHLRRPADATRDSV